MAAAALAPVPSPPPAHRLPRPAPALALSLALARHIALALLPPSLRYLSSFFSLSHFLSLSPLHSLALFLSFSPAGYFYRFCNFLIISPSLSLSITLVLSVLALSLALALALPLTVTFDIAQTVALGFVPHYLCISSSLSWLSSIAYDFYATLVDLHFIASIFLFLLFSSLCPARCRFYQRFRPLTPSCFKTCTNPRQHPHVI